jgi:hypothetical protein
MAVLLGIFEQFTKLLVGQTFPDHRRRRGWESPVGRSRWRVQAHKIVVLVTCAAHDGVYTVPLWATTDPHCVAMVVVALARKIPSGVTIHTTRVT